MSTIIKSLLLTSFLVCCCPAADAQVAGRNEPLAAQVKTAMDRGIEFLRRSQRRDGGWEIDVLPSVGYRGGGTALAVMAMLNCGVPVDDRAIVNGLSYLRDLEPDHTYVRALQTMAYAEARKPEDLLRIQKNVDWLLAGRIVDGQGKLQGWSYGKTGEPKTGPDNSNSQYALLGLWAGKLSGANIDDKVWEQIREFYVRTQNPEDGSWVYSNRGGPGSLTMTTAGLCGLLIAGMEIHSGREKSADVRKDGSVENCGRYEENPQLAKALELDRPAHPFRSAGGHVLQPLRHRKGRPALGPALLRQP